MIVISNGKFVIKAYIIKLVVPATFTLLGQASCV